MAKNETTETAQPTESDLRSQAYNAATRALREKHRAEFNSLMESECAKRGVTYTPRKSPAERAAEKIKALLDEFPEAATMVEVPAVGEGEAQSA